MGSYETTCDLSRVLVTVLESRTMHWVTCKAQDVCLEKTEEICSVFMYVHLMSGLWGDCRRKTPGRRSWSSWSRALISTSTALTWAAPAEELFGPLQRPLQTHTEAHEPQVNSRHIPITDVDLLLEIKSLCSSRFLQIEQREVWVGSTETKESHGTWENAQTTMVAGTRISHYSWWRYKIQDHSIMDVKATSWIILATRFWE